MAHFVLYTVATGALVSSGAAEPAPGAGQAVKRFEADPVAGATWDTTSLDYVPRIAPSARAETVRSRQKLSGTLASTAYPQGTTIKTVAMPGTAVGDPAKAFVENFWWRVAAGTLAAVPAIFADVTDVNQVTIVVNSPVAQTLTLAIGGAVVEYG
jgi:hypothetical protein